MSGVREPSARDMAQCGLFAAVITVCAWLSVPTTIPFTLQTLGVFLAVGLLGTKRAAAAVIVYLLAGAVGLPVFSGFRGGAGAFFAPDGGYLFGFVFAVIISGYGIKRFGGGTFAMAGSMVAGLAVCYIIGTAWYLLVYAGNTGVTGVGAALSLCVVPYILPDAVKIFLAILLTKRLRGHIAL